MDFFASLKRKIEEIITLVLTRLLTTPLRSYEVRVPNSLPNLKQQLRKGDVILISGDQRVSMVIKYLTQSTWSHTAIYIGDELRRYDPARAKQLDERFGDEARFLILEADNDDGVSCTPIKKYANHNLRVCRPRHLLKEDFDRLLKYLFERLGQKYNFRHIFELARYFFPVSIIPRRFRKVVLHYGGEHKHEVICSTLLARAFRSVGYPILPRVTVDEVEVQASFLSRLLRRNGHGIRALYREEDPAVITPRDFDLSPYFDIVKVNHVSEPKFDYRRIEWLSDHEAKPAEAEAIPPQQTVAAGS
jgi:hypothetical protein